MSSLKKAALVAAALLCAVELRAQQSVVVNFPGGSASRNGYSSASVPMQYRFENCEGELWLIARRGDISLSTTYWLDGQQDAIPASHKDDNDLNLSFTADLMQRTPQGARRVTSISMGGVNRASLGNCVGANYFKRLGKIDDLFGKMKTSSERDAVASTLYLENVAVDHPYANFWLESVMKGIRTARKDSIDRAAAKMRRDSVARADSAKSRARQDSIAKARTATSTTPANGQTPANSPAAGQATQTPAQQPQMSRADSIAAADSRKAALAQARADSLQRIIDQQQARQRQAEAEAAAVTQTVGQLGQITKGTSAKAGFLIMSFSADESSAAHFGSGTGYGAGILGKWFFADAGLLKAQFNDYYMQNDATLGVEREQEGYFMTAGLLLPASPLTVGLGYQTVETLDESDSGALITFVGRGKSLAARFDISAMTWGMTYNFGLYFGF